MKERIRLPHHPLAFVPVIFVFLFGSCGGRYDDIQYTKISIADLKHKVDSLVENKDTSTQYFEIPGYYASASVPLLISDLSYLRMNSILPDTSFLVLSGIGEDSVTMTEKDKTTRADSLLAGNPMPEGTYEGAYVSTKLIVRITPQVFANGIRDEGQNILLDTGLVHLIVPEKPLIKRKADQLYSFLNKQITAVKVGSQWPSQNGIVETDPEKYALLYCGGADTANNYERYWNDLVFMYYTLTKKCGFSSKNIIVVYSTGRGFKSKKDIPVDYPATASATRTAVSVLQSEMTDRSTFFMFITNHGGGYNLKKDKADHGRFDLNQDEAAGDSKKWDEEIFLYNQHPNDLWDDSLTVLFSGLRYKKMIALLEPCFGGGLIHDLRGPNRLLFSACGEFEPSFGDYTFNKKDFDTFSYYFTCALNGKTYDNKPVAADIDGDQKISLLEAFLYAQKMDKEAEHPEMDDSGDGIGTPKPDAKSSHGRLSAVTFLD